MTMQGFLRHVLRMEGSSDEGRGSVQAVQLLPKEQLWVARTGHCELYIWSLKDLGQPPQRIHLQDCTEVSCMIRVKRQIWVGGRGMSQGKPRGKIYVMDVERRTVEKELVAHADTVRTLCSAEDRYVLSGAGQEEGKIAIWKVE